MQWFHFQWIPFSLFLSLWLKDEHGHYCVNKCKSKHFNESIAPHRQCHISILNEKLFIKEHYSSISFNGKIHLKKMHSFSIFGSRIRCKVTWMPIVLAMIIHLRWNAKGTRVLKLNSNQTRGKLWNHKNWLKLMHDDNDLTRNEYHKC